MRLSRFQFSLAGMMGVVSAVAIVCAALRYASELWASTLVTLMAAALLAAILGALFQRGQSRAFWAGFALFGWGYLILVISLRVWSGWGVFAPQLLSTKLLASVHVKFQQTAQPGVIPTTGMASGPGSGVTWADLDGDGLMDLYMTNSGGGDSIYSHQGNGVFVDVSKSIGSLPGSSGVPLAATGVATGPSWEHFQQVGNSLFAMLLAFSGGGLASYFYRRSQRTG